jgi:predicted Rossmann-fold nucleotide-binding protein
MIRKPTTLSTRVHPEKALNILSKDEVTSLTQTDEKGLHEIFRKCCLAVLNSGVDIDDASVLMNMYPDFDVQVVQEDRGIKLQLDNAPATAFVDGELIYGVRDQLFEVLRDLVYNHEQVMNSPRIDLTKTDGITHAVFELLRHAELMLPGEDPKMVVCWGGHAISREEYSYTKAVGYELGLRRLDICTGCGSGAMKGPMKGATIGHVKQRHTTGRYIGITEPGIIAAESPNPIVNHLVIMPDIEKRLEAFVRLGHGVIIFPGGVGTCEELLYLLGILLHPANRHINVPFILTGPESAKDYFEQIDRFVRLTLGDEAASKYQIIIDDPVEVGQQIAQGLHHVKEQRKVNNDAFFFNWGLEIDFDYQQPFEATFEAMRSLDIRRDRPTNELAADLRRLFSGIVAGNVKTEGIEEVKKHGAFEINGDPELMKLLDDLLESFVRQQRMKLPGTKYVPCYKIIS